MAAARWRGEAKEIEGGRRRSAGLGVTEERGWTSPRRPPPPAVPLEVSVVEGATDQDGCQGGRRRLPSPGGAPAMACSANHSKGSGSAAGAAAGPTTSAGSSSTTGGGGRHHHQSGAGGIIVGQPAWLQRKIHLRPQHRGVHLVTEEILRQVSPSARHPRFLILIRLT